MVSWRRVVVVVATVGSLTAPASAAAQRPLGIVEHQLGRFDRDTLEPSGPMLDLPEPHARPVFAPDGERFAIGLSKAGASGRIGLWIVDPDRMTVEHEVSTGIAAEAVVYPGAVGALLQNGVLLVVDPETGKIRSRRNVGYSNCAPEAVQAAGRGVIVNEVRGNGVEVAIVEPGGRVHALFVPLATPKGQCRHPALVAGGKRAYIVGREQVVALDPATRRFSTHRVAGAPTSAATVPGGLAVAGPGGARVYDTATWRVRWHARGARSVLASGSTVIATGSDVRARDARSGRSLWRASGGPALTIAAGRVYTRRAVLDLRTGEQVGTPPPTTSTYVFAEARVSATASQETFPYQRLAAAPRHSVLAIGGGVVYTGSPPGVSPVSVMGYPLDGGTRRFALPHRTQALDWLVASAHGVASISAGSAFRLYYGRPAGPLRALRRNVITAGMTGSTLVTLEGPYDREWIVARDVRGGPARRVARPGRGLTYMLAAGHYVSVVRDETIIVLDLRSGREVYRVRPRAMTAYRLAADGRIAILDREFERIQTATPAQPRLRTIANVFPAPYALAIAGDEIVFIESLGLTTGRIVLLTPDGRRRALTPRMVFGGGVAYDGRTLAFIAGRCVFAGRVPAQPPVAAPPADCYPE